MDEEGREKGKTAKTKKSCRLAQLSSTQLDVALLHGVYVCAGVHVVHVQELGCTVE